MMKKFLNWMTNGVADQAKTDEEDKQMAKKCRSPKKVIPFGLVFLIFFFLVLYQKFYNYVAHSFKKQVSFRPSTDSDVKTALPSLPTLQSNKPTTVQTKPSTPMSKSTIHISERTTPNLPKTSQNVPVHLHKDPPIACVTFMGRLGNIMLQYAFLYSIAKTKGLYPAIPPNLEILNYFNIKNTTLESIGKGHQDCKKAESHNERWACSFDEKLVNIPSNKSAKFFGYFQSWKYWKENENDLRKIFQFKDHIKDKVTKQYKNILKTFNFTSYDTIVGIHIRRGDYVFEGVRLFGKLTPEPQYFFNAMDYFKKKHKRVLFLVGTNDMKWCKETLASEQNVYFSEGNSGPEDMALLSMANHTIMSVGTFGWWVGWMARGTTIYYKHMFVPGSRFAKDFKNEETTDFVYPGWIGIQ